MKRILYFTLILAICSACTYRLDIEEPEEITLKFNASLPASFSEVENYDGTKADLKVGELAPKWHPGDFIKVFLPKDGGVEELKSQELTKKDIDPETGEATFTVNFKGVGTSTAGKIGPFFAEYGLPESTELEISLKSEDITKGTAKFLMNIPAKQTYSSEYVYNANECPMLAYAESNTTGAFNLRFQNVYGILKVSFTSSSIITDEHETNIGTEGTGDKEIKAVELVECGNGTNDFISGKFDVTFGEGYYSDTDKTIGPLLEKKAKYGGDSKNKFIVRNTLGSTGNDYYFLLPAGSLASGFKLNILHKDGTYTTMTQGHRTSGGLKRDVITKYTVTGTTIITPKDAPLKTANCYVFPATNGVYSIPATNMGNGAQGNGGSSQETDVEYGQERLYTTNSYPLSYSENYVAEVLWQTKNDDSAVTEGEIITLQGYTKNDKDATKGEIRFNLTGIKGNAVIALKEKTSGTILWSWHIWVVDSNDLIYVKSDKYYDLTGDITLNNSAGTIMNKNLGAYSTSTDDVHAYGLMYQFGRKDPFPGAREVKVSGGDDHVMAYINPENGILTSGAVNSFEESIKSPNTYAIDYEHVWINNATRKVGWTENYKNLYDPCPIGWKVCGYQKFIEAAGNQDINTLWSIDGNGIKLNISNPNVWIPYTGIINDAAWVDVENVLRYTSIGENGGYYKAYLLEGVNGTVPIYNASYFLYTKKVITYNELNSEARPYGHSLPVRCIKWTEPEIPKPTTENTGNLSSYPSGN